MVVASVAHTLYGVRYRSKLYPF